MPFINTLVDDIYATITNKHEGAFSDQHIQEFSDEVSKRLQSQLQERKEAGRLRLSAMGPKCPRALWHSVHTPGEAETLPPYAEIKFTFGHIIEAMALMFAKAAGHTVAGAQDELDLDGVKGHRDCVIDGCIVDVKSAASRSFQKFKDKTIRENDTFGYLDQLDGYLVASLTDPLVTVKDRAYLLAIDKQLGHMCLYEHHLREDSIRARVRAYKAIVARDEPPPCNCGVVEDGKGGNLKLDTRASYSNFKYSCFPNLRTFLYSDGPRYLTKVVKRPAEHIVEVDKHGKIVYN